MSKSKLVMTPAMRASVRLELEAASKEADKAEEAHFRAQECLDTMRMAQQCDHTLEIRTIGQGQIIACTRCHYYWDYPHES